MPTRSPRPLALALALALTGAGTGCLYPARTAPRDAGATGSDGAAEAQAVGPPYNDCVDGAFVDLSAPGASRVIGFGGENDSGAFGVSPRCIVVAAGQTVTIRGPFLLHPISPGVNPLQLTAGSPGNPIPRTASGTTLDVTFPAAGEYPFFCEHHYLFQMSGVVRVR